MLVSFSKNNSLLHNHQSKREQKTENTQKYVLISLQGKQGINRSDANLFGLLHRGILRYILERISSVNH